jgi:hypothetical protein
VGPCVYTTQFPFWLDAGSRRAATDLICFRSNKRWVMAAKLLGQFGTLPILFREQEDSNDTLACRFVAELVQIHFADTFSNNAKKLSWLNEKLWFQWESIQGPKRDESYPTPQSQYEEQEVKKFMAAKTWYIVRDIRQIKPLPLPNLHKLSNSKPLAGNFTRGYALCHYPSDVIQFVSEH